MRKVAQCIAILFQAELVMMGFEPPFKNIPRIKLDEASMRVVTRLAEQDRKQHKRTPICKYYA